MDSDNSITQFRQQCDKIVRLYFKFENADQWDRKQTIDMIENMTVSEAYAEQWSLVQTLCRDFIDKGQISVCNYPIIEALNLKYPNGLVTESDEFRDLIRLLSCKL